MQAVDDGGGGGGSSVSCGGFAAVRGAVRVGFGVGRAVGEALGEALRRGASPNATRAIGVPVTVGDVTVVLAPAVGSTDDCARSPAHPTVNSTTASAPAPIRSTVMSPHPSIDAR
ncbi:hypothetical protein [Salinispora arenicola]|uniref:hypothetical protein n=1 Tax=Salinispora arenicola TaxID=168697 RepID=UPI00036E2AE4|nr:hypothetical protein [Salinispora arenicola]